MKIITPALAAALALVPVPAAAQRAAITPDGYGAVRIGMSRAQAERAFGRRLVGQPIESEQACIELRPAGANSDGLSFMFENFGLTRISVGGTSRVATPRGIRVGATEAQVRTAYGRSLRSEGHRYEGLPARYLTLWTDADRGVRFVTDTRRRVVNIIAGTRSIQYVEGCA